MRCRDPRTAALPARVDGDAKPVDDDVEGGVADRVEAGLDPGPRAGDQVLGHGVGLEVAVAAGAGIVGVGRPQPGGVRAEGAVDEEVAGRARGPEVQGRTRPAAAGPSRPRGPDPASSARAR